MKERPILFTPENAQKVHDGTKTQTRRIVKERNPYVYVESHYDEHGAVVLAMDKDGDYHKYCPYGQVGDRLWIREAHRVINLDNGQTIVDYKGFPVERMRDVLDMTGWLPSSYMRREHCRTVVELTDVRVERLHDISPSDALAEGIFCPEIGYAQHGERAPVLLYGCLWNSINGKDSWAQNPWVWVLSFRKVEP